ncbi:MAG: Rhodanese- sulfurtransferase [Bogoriella megaspora]|nr:MAG: Rhodanese- sulfurtransferase [Bogoriella megaspora]
MPDAEMEIDEGGVSLVETANMKPFKAAEESEEELFEGFVEDDESSLNDQEEDSSLLGDPMDDDTEMSITLNSTNLSTDPDVTIEAAGKLLPKASSNDTTMTWEPPSSTPTLENELYTNKPTLPNHDLGHLLIVDPNPLPPRPSNAVLNTNAQSAAQSLITQLLTTRPIHRSGQSLLINLPPPEYPLPREKSIPSQKPKTRWQEFAERKGITKKKKGGDGGGQRVWDESKGDWVARWGKGGRNKEGEGEWLVEVDGKGANGGKDGENGGGDDPRAVKRAERKERARREERRMRANEKRAQKGRL